MAELLGVSLADLALWIEGDAVPSISIFSRALDIVADGDVRAAPRKKRPPPKS
ncbi:MAG TPA: hypothetical protein VFA72_07490 [Burkholderiales bacterium]|nr:hypothetical protein [Burkholderiales bacterium]